MGIYKLETTQEKLLQKEWSLKQAWDKDNALKITNNG